MHDNLNKIIMQNLANQSWIKEDKKKQLTTVIIFIVLNIFNEPILLGIHFNEICPFMSLLFVF